MDRGGGISPPPFLNNMKFEVLKKYIIKYCRQKGSKFPYFKYYRDGKVSFSIGGAQYCYCPNDSSLSIYTSHMPRIIDLNDRDGSDTSYEKFRYLLEI